MNPKVSIITPCYNSERFIGRYIDRILNQSYDNIQLIFVNDGSTDQTESIIMQNKSRIISKGYELTYIRQENMGLGGAINTGLKEIKGEYFTWCDSDNFYTDDYVSTKVDFFLNNPQYSVVRCDGFIVDESDIDNPIGKMSQGNSDLYNPNLFENCLLVKNFHFGCAMIKTIDFDRVNKERQIYPSRAGQNWQLLLPVFYQYQSGYIDKPMFYFVVRKDSISNITQYQSTEDIIQKLEEYERILINTLIRMKIPEENLYIKKIKTKYELQKFYVYVYAHESDNIEQQYQLLKENNIKPNIKIWLAKQRGKHKNFDSIIKLFR